MSANRLAIKTILGDQSDSGRDGVLLLQSAEGVENFSTPFAYELTMLIDLKKLKEQHGHFDLRSLVNTPATLRIKVNKDVGLLNREEYTFVRRHGVFEWVSLGGSWEGFTLCRARLVPGVAMLAYQTAFRIFERMDVVAILEEVMAGFPDVKVNFDALRKLRGAEPDRFPKLEVCVQFGETTLNFISRMMQAFGIWYYFDHALDGSSETMVLGSGQATFTPCQAHGGTLHLEHAVLDRMSLTTGEPSVFAISDFTKHLTPTDERVVTGNFNPVTPTDPAWKEQRLLKDYDLLGAGSPKLDPSGAPMFRDEIFPAQFLKDAQTEADAKRRVEALEAAVVTVSGSCKNATFMTGHTFRIDSGLVSENERGSDTITRDSELGRTVLSSQGPTFKPGYDQATETKPYLLSFIHFKAYESSYGHNVLNDIGAFLSSFLSPVLDLFRKGKVLDLTLAATAGGMNNYIKSVRQNTLQNDEARAPHSNVKTTTNLQFGHYFDAGALASVTTLIPLLAASIPSAINDVKSRHADDYSNSFVAVAPDAKLPLPSGRRPVASGPHLALVIGPTGVSPGNSDYYVDALGRVRVRFPWQRTVPVETGGHDTETDPLKTDRRTCWVRVAEGWAGVRFGSQFVPRIGDEVIVSFLDGDPDRPIVTGRVYNAASGGTQLPFPSSGAAGQSIDVDYLLNAAPTGEFARSGLRTRSTPMPCDDQGNPKGDERYHLMRFDDTYGDEQLLLRSQARLDVTAKRSLYETTEGNRHVRVQRGKDKDGNAFGGGAFTTINGEQDLHVGDSRYAMVEKDDQLTVKGDTRLDLKGDCVAVVGGALSVNAGTIVFEAAQKITLKVGGSTLVLNPCGAYLDGAMVYNQCGGPADTARDVTIKDVADATKADPGEPPGSRDGGGHAGGGGHGGGGRGQHTVPAQHAPECTDDSEHMVCLPVAALCGPEESHP